MKKIILKTLKVLLLTVLAFLAVVLLAHGIGGAVNRRTPKGGINESLYVEINGVKHPYSDKATVEEWARRKGLKLL